MREASRSVDAQAHAWPSIPLRSKCLTALFSPLMAACEHGCPGRRCHGDTPCNDCPVLVEHTPSCGHRGRYQCSQVAKEPETIRCRASVTLQLPCSHSVKAECYRVGAALRRSAASLPHLSTTAR